MKRSPKIGDLVRITFLDHCQSPTRVNGLLEPAECILVGYLAADKKTHYGITSWVSGTLDDDGSDYSVVVKSVGLKIEILEAF